MIPEQQPYLDVKSTQGIYCTNCDGVFFDQTFILRKVSKLYTGTGKDEQLPIPVFTCRSCNTPLLQHLPQIPDLETKLGLTPKIQL